jgi:hypothetical protein
MKTIKTKKQLRSDMVKSAIIYHMVDGTFGDLPAGGKRGKRDNTGGVYNRVREFVKTQIGGKIGQGTITSAIRVAVENGAPTVTKPSATIKVVDRPNKRAPKVYHTEIPSNASRRDREIVFSYDNCSDKAIVALSKRHMHMFGLRKATCSGICVGFDARGDGKLVGKQRFALLMALAKS